MLETSQDLLYVIVALCTFVFTIFLVWIMYYLAQIMKQSNEIISDVREELAELSKTIANIKEKVNSSATSIAFVANQIKDIAGFLHEKKGKKKK